MRANWRPITVKRAALTSDDGAGVSAVYSTVLSTFAEIQEKQGRITDESNNLRFVSYIECRVKHRAGLSFQESDLVVYSGVSYSISGVAKKEQTDGDIWVLQLIK